MASSSTCSALPSWSTWYVRQLTASAQAPVAAAAIERSLRRLELSTTHSTAAAATVDSSQVAARQRRREHDAAMRRRYATELAPGQEATHTASATRPLPQATIDSLPTFAWAETHLAQECTICMRDFYVGETLCALPCAHCFHQGCIDSWLARCGTCPLCRCRPASDDRVDEAQRQCAPIVHVPPRAHTDTHTPHGRVQGP